MHIKHAGLLALVVLALVACTGAPVDRGATVHFNYNENPLGDQYRYSADEVSSTWTFNQDADFVLSFEGGSVSYEGTALEPGCYSDRAQEGDVLELDSATSYEFISPATDEECEPVG